MNVDVIYRNIDNDLNEEDVFFIEAKNYSKKLNTELVFLDYLTEYEFQYEEDSLVIDGHTGSYISNNIQKAILKDVFITNEKIIDNIYFYWDFYLDYMPYKKEKFVKIKLRINLKDTITSAELKKPLLCGYVSDEKNNYVISEMNSRGPFKFIKKDNFIEVYCTEPYNDPEKEYKVNVIYKLV